MKQLYLLMLFCTIVPITAHATVPLFAIHQAAAGDTSYRIVPAEAGTYGYEILVNRKLLIRQKNVPGLPGNRGFVTKADAAATARLVIQKLQQGIMPPTVTTKELDSLGIRLQHF